MKRILPIIYFTVLICMGCTNSSHSGNQGIENAMNPSPEPLPEINSVAESSMYGDSRLLPFRNIIDTLNSIGDPYVHSDYFLHDITGDGQPELWIISGTCEADKELWVYQITGGHIKKILSDNGGHTDFFLRGNSIGSLTCNTGSGYVSAYSYRNGKIRVESIEYDGSQENEQVIIKSARDRQIADIWEYSDSTIQPNPLK